MSERFGSEAASRFAKRFDIESAVSVWHFELNHRTCEVKDAKTGPDARMVFGGMLAGGTAGAAAAGPVGSIAGAIMGGAAALFKSDSPHVRIYYKDLARKDEKPNAGHYTIEIARYNTPFHDLPECTYEAITEFQREHPTWQIMDVESGPNEKQVAAGWLAGFGLGGLLGAAGGAAAAAIQSNQPIIRIYYYDPAGANDPQNMGYHNTEIPIADTMQQQLPRQQARPPLPPPLTFPSWISTEMLPPKQQEVRQQLCNYLNYRLLQQLQQRLQPQPMPQPLQQPNINQTNLPQFRL